MIHVKLKLKLELVDEKSAHICPYNMIKLVSSVQEEVNKAVKKLIIYVQELLFHTLSTKALASAISVM